MSLDWPEAPKATFFQQADSEKEPTLICCQHCNCLMPRQFYYNQHINNCEQDKQLTLFDLKPVKSTMTENNYEQKKSMPVYRQSILKTEYKQEKNEQQMNPFITLNQPRFKSPIPKHQITEWSQQCYACGMKLLVSQLQNHQEYDCIMGSVNCPSCFMSMMRCELKDHETYCTLNLRQKLYATCAFCKKKYLIKLKKFHIKQCLQIRRGSAFIEQADYSITEQQDPINLEEYLEQDLCIWCFADKKQMEQPSKHEGQCPVIMGQKRFMLSLEEKQELRPVQLKALFYLRETSANSHAKYRPQVMHTIHSMNLKTEDLDKMVSYLQNEAPIVIHFNFKDLLKNYHKRQILFPVSPVQDKRRGLWQNFAFKGIYEGATWEERVKYGTIQLANQYSDIQPFNTHQGDSFMILKENVRQRCSISRNKGILKAAPSDRDVSDLHYCYAILSQFSTKQLETLYMASNNLMEESNQFYRKVQIHGPIRLSHDVSYIYLPTEDLCQYEKEVKEISGKYQIEIRQCQNQ